MDTFIFMLRKSNRQVTFLHVFHHSSITIVTAIAVNFDTSGDTYLASLLNSWVRISLPHFSLAAPQTPRRFRYRTASPVAATNQKTGPALEQS